MKLKTPQIDQEQGFSNGLSIRLTWRVCEENITEPQAQSF